MAPPASLTSHLSFVTGPLPTRGQWQRAKDQPLCRPFAESVRNIWKIEELRRRILFTLGILVVYRVGAYVTLPGVDARILAQVSDQSREGLFGLFDLFVGGAFFQAGIFALGIMPYITASIIIQLLGAVVPYFQKLQREGEDGRRKITQLTRYGTVGITALQAIGYAINLQYGATGQAIVVNHTFFMVTTVIVLTAGTVFVMWLGERITEKGIGNGISLLIMIGIIAFLPQSLFNEFELKEQLLHLPDRDCCPGPRHRRDQCSCPRARGGSRCSTPSASSAAASTAGRRSTSRSG